MRCGAHCDTRSRNIKPSRTGIAEAAERLNTGQKCEGATGSLAIVASGHGSSRPRSLHHGSRLPAMSRVGPHSEIKRRFVARPLVRPGPNAYQVPQTARVFGAPRRHSPILTIPGVL